MFLECFVNFLKFPVTMATMRQKMEFLVTPFESATKSKTFSASSNFQELCQILKVGHKFQSLTGKEMLHCMGGGRGKGAGQVNANKMKTMQDKKHISKCFTMNSFR